MSMDIENIDTFETINQVHTIKWRQIYEVIDEAYFIGSKLFSDDCIKECNYNSNEARDITREVKNNIKLMATEQGLHSHVIMIHRKYLKFVAADKNKN